MTKKLIIILFALILLTSCAKTNNTDTNVIENNNEFEEQEVEELKPIGYTGEIIVDGYYGDKGTIYFVPDKETKELIEKDFQIEIGGSIPLDYDTASLVKDLPEELGIYKVEIKADFTVNNLSAKLESIKLTDTIGTVEYEGKTYTTNDLDENVKSKDKVCGLIVKYVRKVGDDGLFIYFAGEIESEGFYNVYPGGDYYNFIRIGRIVPDEEYKKNFPTYKGEGNNFSVFFAESNDLYSQLAGHSAIGRGKFKTRGYHLIINHGGGLVPRESLSEIISLDKDYKGLFTYDYNARTLLNESNKYQAGFMNKYAIAFTPQGINSEYDNYFFLGKEEKSKILIHYTDEFSYRLKENYTDETFELESSGKNQKYGVVEKPHTIQFRYFDKTMNYSGGDLLLKKLNYGMFYKDGSVQRIYEGDEFLGLVAEDINVEYHCIEKSTEELVRIIARFSGETTLTGKLTYSYDEEFGYKAAFIVDSEGVKKLPIHVGDTREQIGFILINENLEELLGTEPFEKECKITINNYNIHFAATEASNTAELVELFAYD